MKWRPLLGGFLLLITLGPIALLYIWYLIDNWREELDLFLIIGCSLAFLVVVTAGVWLLSGDQPSDRRFK
jgi:hypothetical protein